MVNPRDSWGRQRKKKVNLRDIAGERRRRRIVNPRKYSWGRQKKKKKVNPIDISGEGREKKKVNPIDISWEGRRR